jgi:magnesium chelatase family protein
MLSTIYSGATWGLDGILVTIEVDVAERGFPTFTIVGLPGKEINESKDRIRTALANTGFEVPDSRLTVNLAPADIPKTGSRFDMAIAIGILAAQSIISSHKLQDSFFIGELSLEGKVRPVTGVLSLVLMAVKAGKKSIFVCAENATEAAFVDEATIYPVASLAQLIAHLQGAQLIQPQVPSPLAQPPSDAITDFADVRGQIQAKRALEIAAAGGHNIHLKGVPGAGKTLLARSFVSILPDLAKPEMLEVTRIYSVAGLLGSQALITIRPFRSPHHTTSRIGLIGGGSNPMPGEISLAHRGVLFLDEFAEYERGTLEALRQPMEDGIVTISRAAGTVAYPSRFLLLAASNPCPCGYLGHPTRRCTCPALAVQKYQKRLSGPILDRIDLHIDIPPVSFDKLHGEEVAESSSVIKRRVIAARERQLIRLQRVHKYANAEMSSVDVRKLCTISDGATSLLRDAAAHMSLSARSHFKIIKVAQTIADLAQSDTIMDEHLAEALQYRPKGE